MTLLFREDTHEYTYDGVPLPGVTEIVSPLGPSYDDPDVFAETAIENAAERGTVMHAYIAHRLEGGGADDFEMPDSFRPYADSVELFLSEHNIFPLLAETPLACPDFAGTPDLVCEFDGTAAILDYKFVRTVQKSKVGAQLAGYALLCEHNMIFPDSLAAVQFLPAGDYRLYPVNRPRAEAAFNACLEVYRLKNQRHPKGSVF